MLRSYKVTYSDLGRFVSLVLREYGVIRVMRTSHPFCDVTVELIQGNLELFEGRCVSEQISFLKETGGFEKL